MKASTTFYILLFLFLAFVAIIPDTKQLFGFDIQLISHGVKLVSSFSGPLLANRLLSNADRLYYNEIRGPECFATYKNQTYTGLIDGRIVRILDSQLETVAFINPANNQLEKCQNFWFSSAHCARPLGIRFDSKGFLYAVDPYHGLWRVNVESGKYELIMSADRAGAKFLDDLILLEKPNGHLVFYMSDASTEWQLYDVVYLVSEYRNTGRILKFDTETGTVSTVLDNLYFPNGLEWLDDKKAFLIAEYAAKRILKYDIEKGEVKVLNDLLPGEPDNIKRSPNPDQETFWVGIFSGRNTANPSLPLDFLTPYPFLRRFFFRLTRLIGATIEQAGHLIDCDKTREFGFKIKTNLFANLASSDYGMGIEIDSNGNILDSLHSPDGHVKMLSEVYEAKRTPTERVFYLGSFLNNYLGKLIIKTNNNNNNDGKIPIQPTTASVKVESKTTTAKPTTSTTTTTSKPTTKASKDVPEKKETSSKHSEL